MENNKWRTLAIVFIILFSVETIFFVSIAYVGLKQLEREDDCKTFCYQFEYGDSFLYDEETKLCQCWKDGEVKYSEVIK